MRLGCLRINLSGGPRSELLLVQGRGQIGERLSACVGCGAGLGLDRGLAVPSAALPDLPWTSGFSSERRFLNPQEFSLSTQFHPSPLTPTLLMRN